MHVLILTEGSHEWGLGHLYRCHSFARYFAKKGIAVNWLVNGDTQAERFLMDQALGNAKVADWTQFGVLNGHLENCICAIIDSYHAPRECYDWIAARVSRCVWIDDEARMAYPRGTVVNPNPQVAQRITDLVDGRSVLLTGFEYQLLREQFSQSHRRKFPKTVRRLLVMMGGTDLRELTPNIVESIRSVYPQAKLDVIIPSDKQRETWSYLASSVCTLHSVRSASEIVDLMRVADLAITAAGQTLCEAASQGLPTLAIGVAENQRIHAEALQRLGVIGFVGWHDDPDLTTRLKMELLRMGDEASRRDMGERGMRTFDGKGVLRIMGSVMHWCELQELRDAVMSDSEQVWKISNLPSVREYSITKGEIPWGDHSLWFEKAIKNPDQLFQVLEWEGKVVGQLRYKRISSNAAGVSISLAEEMRGQGLAVKMLKEGDLRCFAVWPEITRVDAEISPLNIASMNAFLRAGYARTEESREYTNQPFCIFRKELQHEI